MIIQIYEIQTPEEAEQCIEVGVDNIGSVILSEDEWRQPGLKETISVSEGTHVKNSIIPLFRKTDTIYRVLDYYRPDFIHFCENLANVHGEETDLNQLIDLQSTLRERFPDIKIIRSIPIPMNDTAFEFRPLEIAGRMEPVCDFFLIDTWLGKEPVAGFIGITGRTSNWEKARDLVLQSKIPVILAGGLSPENVYEALEAVSPAGADSCTNTNKVDHKGNPIRFQKDFKRVEKFIDEARRAERM